MPRKGARPTLLLLLLAAAAASAGFLVSGAAAQSPAPPAAPLVITAQANSSGSATGQELLNTTLSSVNQTVGSFYAIRACIPYNLVIEPTPFQGPAAGGSTNATNATSGASPNQGRIQITADYYVINATQASVVNGVLSLSLLQGFESHQPIEVTVYTSPGRQLRYVANYGPGNVVLRPGLNVSTFEVESNGVGQVLTYGVTADALRVRSNGIAGSIMRGRFRNVQVTASGTGTLVVTSGTPAQVTADVSGITTLLLDVPAGSTINGTADGLGKVQYTSGTCNIQSASQLLFPVPSIFGRRGGPFPSFGSLFGGGSGPSSGPIDNGKCEQVAASAVSSYTEGAGPQWSCGLVADGRSSCAADGTSGSNGTASGGIITWSITNLTSAPFVVQNSSTPLDQLVANAVSSDIRSRVNNAAQNATTGNAAAGPPALDTVTGFFPPVGTAGEPPLADGNASVSNSNSGNAVPVDGTAGNAANGGAGNAAGGNNAANNAGGEQPAPTALGGAPNALMAAVQQATPPNDTVTPVTSSSPGPQATTTPTPGGVTTTSTPEGTVTTGATTSGPGSFASGTGSVSNGTSGFTQNTLSADGGVPLTTLLPGGIGGVVWNPVFVPALTRNALPDLSEPSPAPAGSTDGTGTAASVGSNGTDGETVATGAQNSTGAGGDTSFTAPGAGGRPRFATNVPQPAIGQAVSVAGPGQSSGTSSGTSMGASGAPGSVAGVAVASTTCAAMPGALLIPRLA